MTEGRKFLVSAWLLSCCSKFTNYACPYPCGGMTRLSCSPVLEWIDLPVTWTNRWNKLRHYRTNMEIFSAPWRWWSRWSRRSSTYHDTEVLTQTPSSPRTVSAMHLIAPTRLWLPSDEWGVRPLSSPTAQLVTQNNHCLLTIPRQ